MPLNSQKRLIYLPLTTKTVLDSSDLTLTQIGRALDTDTTVKNAIKRIDRLLGNRNLHHEKESIYKWHASFTNLLILCPWFWLIERMFESNIYAAAILGESQLAKRSPLKCFAYLYKSHSKK